MKKEACVLMAQQSCRDSVICDVTFGAGRFEVITVYATIQTADIPIIS